MIWLNFVNMYLVNGFMIVMKRIMVWLYVWSVFYVEFD